MSYEPAGHPDLRPTQPFLETLDVSLSTPAHESLLDRNLRALGHRSEPAARAIRQALPIAQGAKRVEFEHTQDGLLTARLIAPGEAHEGARLLASAKAPLVEATRFADSVDVKAHATIVVRGFGLGHHAQQLATRLGATGVLICFEPDVGLLRAVLERIDITPIVRATRFILCTDPHDHAALGGGFEGLEALIAAGVTIVDHPASKARLGEASDHFAKTLAKFVQGVRTNVVTTLAHSEVTLRNLLGNAPIALQSQGIADLRDTQQGCPAIVVSAGPSLQRTIDLLKTPGLRDRVVIIAAQTVLKQLLAKGIKPHFVTALDYHEISTRFYEGLTRQDVEGITLVIEPKCNPAIPRAFPATSPDQIRCVGDDVLAKALGPALAPHSAPLPPGATVAHLSYYLARFLGCDPVLLIGQDLAFTDNLYYAPGAAIHQVWSAEVNEFCSLETLEWQRIMRMRAHLRKVPALGGGEVYTDEQMATYLQQFERDFARDAQAGLTTIDATQGGALKRHAPPMPLQDAFQQLGVLSPPSSTHAPAPSPTPSPALAHANIAHGSLSISFDASIRPASPGPATLAPTLRPAPPLHPWPVPQPRTNQQALLAKRFETLAHQARDIAQACEQTRLDLERMLAHHSDQSLVNRLIQRVLDRGTQVTKLEAHWLVQQLNQTGQLNRFKADRAIELADHASPLERQRDQISRDIQNVSWLRDAASALESMLREAAAASRSNASPARARTPQDASLARETGLDGRARRVIATMWLDATGMLAQRDLAQGVLGSPTMLHATLARLERVPGLDGVLLITDDATSARSLLARGSTKLPITIEALTRHDGDRVRGRLRSVRAARLASRHCWRSGLANFCVYDELLHPAIWRSVLAKHDIDAVLLVGPDWFLVDHEASQGVIERYREAPRRHAFTFTQAPPGLAGAVASSDLIDQLASPAPPPRPTTNSPTTPPPARPAWLASLGQLLGYHPLHATIDPTSKPACVPISPVARDLLLRCIGDDPNFVHLAQALHAAHPNDWAAWPLATLAQALHDQAVARAPTLAPEVLRIILDASTPMLDVLAIATRLRSALAATRAPTPHHTATTLAIESPDGSGPWRELADLAPRLGFAGVHVRLGPSSAEALGTDALARALIDAIDLGIDVVSLDVLADSPQAWSQLGGCDLATAQHHLASLWDAMQLALDERTRRSGTTSLPTTWLVPRMQRREATLPDMESFCDRWLLTAGACVIDPPPPPPAFFDSNQFPRTSERLTPLPLPATIRERMAWSIRALDIHALAMPAAPFRALPTHAPIDSVLHLHAAI